MIIICVIIAVIAVAIVVYVMNMEKYCNCAGFGTRKVTSRPYYNYSNNDTTKYGARDLNWPVGTPYDVYSMKYNAAMNKNAAQYAADKCGVKFVEMPSTGYKTAKRAPAQMSYTTTPEGHNVPIMSDGLFPITMNPAGSFTSPSETPPKSCASFSPYNMSIGVL